MDAWDVRFNHPANHLGDVTVRVEAVTGAAAITLARHDWPELAAAMRRCTAAPVTIGEGGACPL